LLADAELLAPADDELSKRFHNCKRFSNTAEQSG
jgi:hypothetical protein